MLVCHCFQLTDRDVKALALAGELPCMGAEGRPGSACGGCLPAVLEIHAEAVSGSEPAEAFPALAGFPCRRRGGTQSVA